VAMEFLLFLVVAATKMAWSSGRVVARVGDYSWPPPVFSVRVVVPSPEERQKATLINCSCH